ncbi:hypothetical protein PLICRDRAFT_170708 [Plicaturopsis crispa FD-325 SS-3]|nr:hypothetical protein PLICRDRAFT_170708 [Plicaturopsis crispa FD-325 SS-3]
MPLCHGLPLEEATIDEVQHWLSTGKLTSRDIVKCYEDRMHVVDGHLGAVMEFNPDAYKIADELDAERARGIVRGPMHGIPVFVKDNIATKDKMQTTAGSLALVGSIAPRDAHVVALLRKAGAIIMGHTNLSEWADMRSTSYSEGYSSRRGQCRNSFNLTQEPGGSSSGSGHAVSANLIMVAYGTETDGSVISPGERASVIGIKPTVGLTSRAGVIPESTNQDTVGAFGRTFKDAVYALETIVGIDDRDTATFAQEGRSHKNYTQFLSNTRALKGAKFGLPWKNLWDQPSAAGQLPALLDALKVLKAAGAIIYNNTDYKYQSEIVSSDGWNWDYEQANKSEFTVVKVDFYNNVNAYLKELTNTTMKNLGDIIAFDDAMTAVEGGIPGTAPAFASGQDGLLDSFATGGVEDETYKAALAWGHKSTRELGIDYALKHGHNDFFLDALLIPSDDSGPGTEAPARAGYPIITVPISVDEWSVPFGLSIVSTAFSEPTLIKYGSAIDDALGKRRVKPTFHDFDAINIPVDFGPS